MRGTNTIKVVLTALLLGVAISPARSEEASKAEAGGDAPAKAKNAEVGKAIPLPKLRSEVKSDIEAERATDQKRLETFRAAQAEQERLLAEAKATLLREEAVSEKLEDRYNANEQTFEKNEARLEERLGQLGELFGVVRQVATDAGGNMWASITSAELGQRKELLDRLGRSKELPSTLDLESLWYELQREMTAQGEIVTFPASVVNESGEVEDLQVTRVGPFAALAQGRYLKWKPEEGKLFELPRQPPPRYLTTVAEYQSTEQGYAQLAVDPSRGALMEALTDTPSAWERVQQGKFIGYVIIVLGAFAFVLGMIRWVAVTITGRKVAAQQRSPVPRPDNPLGRVLRVYEDGRGLDPEHLEQTLDDAVLKESGRLTRLLWLIQTVSIVAPLLGLLGTVTGMIQTFQAITLYGTGDPKVMAGGISEALVTTMLGLIAAIPLVLVYGVLSSSTRRIQNILDENVANPVAERSETSRA
jgi:biopolymer transport protein ExbB